MKRIFLICSLLIASVSYSNAQQAVAPPLDVAAPVSKPEFTQKVKDLDNLIEHNNTAAADKKFDELSTMINAELKVVRYQMRDAKSESERHAALETTKTQRGMYAQIMTLKTDMAANRKALIEKLNEFADTIK